MYLSQVSGPGPGPIECSNNLSEDPKFSLNGFQSAPITFLLTFYFCGRNCGNGCGYCDCSHFKTTFLNPMRSVAPVAALCSPSVVRCGCVAARCGRIIVIRSHTAIADLRCDAVAVLQPVGENYANPKTCFFHVLFKAAALAFYILFALFIDNFVIIFVVTVLLAALDFWVVKNVSGRILVGLRWWNEINDEGESVWKFESLDQESLARMNKKDSWLFWWTLYLTAIAWIILAIFSLIRLQADYLLVVGVCLTLSIANIVGFTRCQKDAKKQIQQYASRTIASQFSSTLQSAFSVV
ncbi:hypothetical protein Lal_00004144 [Lupinus albus]|nr:hypothetical protein Lal_00004144 [Lupinus albus]